ncbi:hypothetical protein I5G81_gp88 [Mycobacterium phage Shandong1]|uniref:Uncharacterized protein n=1 Tax=Mycobacterium phage Shandong1 TaxID=1983447 RepID=A0A1X9SHM7_9CAUD|nr:hypothetical protein I5G81_gp88 [Mycobacterium phage Shandong1]ARQ95527.1 hypothetical protein [Mycobacterium phage Shandong1]
MSSDDDQVLDERNVAAFKRYMSAMAWQLHHAGQEPERERLRALFGTS